MDTGIDGTNKEFGSIVVSFLCHHSAAWTNFADNICVQQQNTTTVHSKFWKTSKLFQYSKFYEEQRYKISQSKKNNSSLNILANSLSQIFNDKEFF